MGRFPKAVRLSMPGTGLVVAVQDTFGGRTFRQMNGSPLPGHVYSAGIDYSAYPLRATADDNRAVTNWRVVEEVHPNTVRAFLRRAGQNSLKLQPGSWYRVIED